MEGSVGLSVDLVIGVASLPSLTEGLHTMAETSILGLLGSHLLSVIVFMMTRGIIFHGGLAKACIDDQSCRKASVATAYGSGRQLK